MWKDDIYERMREEYAVDPRNVWEEEEEENDEDDKYDTLRLLQRTHRKHRVLR